MDKQVSKGDPKQGNKSHGETTMGYAPQAAPEGPFHKVDTFHQQMEEDLSSWTCREIAGRFQVPAHLVFWIAESITIHTGKYGTERFGVFSILMTWMAMKRYISSNVVTSYCTWWKVRHRNYVSWSGHETIWWKTICPGNGRRNCSTYQQQTLETYSKISSASWKKTLLWEWARKCKEQISTQEVYKWKARLNQNGGKQEYGVNH